MAPVRDGPSLFERKRKSHRQGTDRFVLVRGGCVCSREQDLVCFCGPNLHVTTFQTGKTSMLDLPYESDIDRVRRKDEIRGRTVMHLITVSSLLAHSDPMAASKKREVG